MTMLKAINKPDYVHKARHDRGHCFSCSKRIQQGEYYMTCPGGVDVHNNCTFTHRPDVVNRCSMTFEGNLSGQCENQAEYENQNGVKVCKFHMNLLNAFTWESRDKRKWVNIVTGTIIKEREA